MDQSLAIMLQKLCYGKVSFEVLVPGRAATFPPTTSPATWPPHSEALSKRGQTAKPSARKSGSLEAARTVPDPAFARQRADDANDDGFAGVGVVTAAETHRRAGFRAEASKTIPLCSIYRPQSGNFDAIAFTEVF